MADVQWMQSNEWDENLESPVAILIIEAYAVPKLEKWHSLRYPCFSATFCPLVMWNHRIPVRLADTWFIQGGQREYKKQLGRKEDDKEMTGRY